MELISRKELKKVGIYCINHNIRKAMRVVTALYDEILRPAGIRSTQFSILATIYYKGSINLTRLANLLVIDRTTLIRNVEVLERDELVEFLLEQKGNTRKVKITHKGIDKIQNAFPLWETAQESIVHELGEEQWKDLIRSLSLLVKVAGKHTNDQS
ncbi:MAG: winged helix-turn-helix transcriptional regulator [Leptospiraceae bacterium]|nr:winged helix-turn-helix transcriptional regulator [Leptospiraceae bacterium]MCP5494788.1 winged helix-turn-helix transcriptional regulator [Leptospiraceae bacterium]